MLGDYHSVTCWVDCDGWPCECWCHDDESTDVVPIKNESEQED